MQEINEEKVHHYQNSLSIIVFLFLIKNDWNREGYTWEKVNSNFCFHLKFFLFYSRKDSTKIGMKFRWLKNGIHENNWWYIFTSVDRILHSLEYSTTLFRSIWFKELKRNDGSNVLALKYLWLHWLCSSPKFRKLYSIGD